MAEQSAAYRMVKQFHEVYSVAIDQPPTWALRTLRASLIDEEASETIAALLDSDGGMTAIADGLADLLYVVYGAAISLGIDIDAVLQAVHESNMSKLDAAGKPIYRADGKILKGPNFKPPAITADMCRCSHG